MLLQDILQIVSAHWIEYLLALGIIRLASNKWCYGIQRIPGPWLAAYTNLWRFIIVWNRHPEIHHVKLHRQYGDIVRLGPNVVSVTDIDAVKQIYALNSGFIKVMNPSLLMADRREQV
jgi:hypothetical protein